MTTDTAAAAPRRAVAGVRAAVADVLAGRALLAFYLCVLTAAWVGSAIAAENWLGWVLIATVPAVGLYELGGVTLAIFARNRRQKGERAIPARLLSLAFAGGAVAINLLGHTTAAGDITGPGYFFAGLSAAAYVVYLIEDAAKRRDALREEGKLAEPPPVYGLYQWLRHPWLTARARALAIGNAEIRLVERITSRESGGPDQPTTPLLGRAASLAAAADQVAAEKRLAAIRTALRRRIAAGVDPTMAKIAVHTYDLGRVAQGIADDADYPALTGLLTAELTPGRIATSITTRRRSWLDRRRETAETTPETTAAAVETAARPALPELPAPPAPRTPLNQAETPKTGTGDTTETPSNGHVDQAPALPNIAPHLLPYLAAVMHAHQDWAVTITLPGRHPEALTGSKIKSAAGISGQQLATDIRGTLLTLAAVPEAARDYVLTHATTATA